MTPLTRRAALRLGGGGLAAALAGCLGGGEPAVAMTDDLVFDPESLTVDVGTTVVWRNEGSVPHTVTAREDALPAEAAYFASGGFASEAAARDDIRGGYVREGEAFSHVFEVAGTYPYVCIPHEGSGMVGTVRVR